MSLFTGRGEGGKGFPGVSTVAEPALDLRRYFNGEIKAVGVYFDFAGRARRQFHIDVTGSWQGNEGTLTEFFTFDDGSVNRRLWTIKVEDSPENPGYFTGSAPDVVGIASGVQRGNAARMHYVLRIARGKKSFDVTMDDRLYLLDDKRMINRARMKKFGIKVGELAIAFEKV